MLSGVCKHLKEKKDLMPLINEQIRDPKVQLINHLGENIGVVSRNEALRLAEEAELDLVLLSQTGKYDVPVVKIMDCGKVLYEKKKKQAEAKKKQKVIQVKEIKIRPMIGEHDYQTKFKHIMTFLEEGKRVKITIFFKGRENMSKQERGTELFEKINKSFEEAGVLQNVVQEQDTSIGQMWSRIYYLKETK
jgi:translation initiation factor IF-3